MDKSKQINLHINELVLDGFTIKDQHHFGQALQMELQRLLAEQGIPSGLHNSGAVARLDGGELNHAPGNNSAQLGVQVAQRIYGGFGR
ncbi:MAG: hypothetical protein OEZ39_05715 [Gammaproteobacteria bacterium]|nr:hypothetical protein [Gammaproteobacteria bacterium]MDH5651352.1 hypothetical protein [Gammaproteobacteria bacterium]